MMATPFDTVLSVMQSALSLAMPLILASLGEIVTERAGVMNLGLEGIMAMGAFAAFTVTYFTGNFLLGTVAAVFVGVVFGLLFGFLTIRVRVNQTILGIAVVLFGVALGGYLYRIVFGAASAPLISPTMIQITTSPALTNLPVIGPLLFTQSYFFYFSLAMVLIVGFLLYHTTIGLNIRAVGEDPKAADTMGLRVFLIRYSCVIFGSIMAATAGAGYGLSAGTFREYYISGRGWIAIALVVFSRWNPYLSLAGALVFGAANAAQMRLQTMSVGISANLFLMLPYVLTIIALVLIYRGAGRPASLGKPYKRGE